MFMILAFQFVIAHSDFVGMCRMIVGVPSLPRLHSRCASAATTSLALCVNSAQVAGPYGNTIGNTLPL
jgi:hypothetical protein